MGRLAGTKPEETRERILQAATKVFADRGFGGARVRLIAQEAGVNVATLSYHFGDKRGLYGTVVQHFLKQSTESITQLSFSGSDWATQLIRQIWEYTEEHREGARLLMRHMLDADHLQMACIQGIGLADLDVILANSVGIEPQRARLLLHSLSCLMTRYVIADDAERVRLSGAENTEEARELLIQHMISLICPLALKRREQQSTMPTSPPTAL